MRELWLISAAFVLGWVCVCAVAYGWLVWMDRRARRDVSPSNGLGPGFGLSGGQVRRKAARGRTEAQRRYGA